MRRLSVLTLSVTVPALVLVAPTWFSASPAPHPVAPHVERVALQNAPAAQNRAMATQSADGLAAAGLPDRPDIVTPESSADDFKLIGITWDGATTGVSVSVRVREGGKWTSWQEIEPADTYPDNNSADAKRAAGRQATEPLLTAGADAYQVAMDATDGQQLSNVEAVLVNPGSSDADATIGQFPAGSAVAAPPTPGMHSRASWGADENLRLSACPEGPSYSSTVKVGFVHHTADSNNYTAAQVPGILRSIYAFHVQGRGWCDIGYNFLIDKFGRVFEGRFGGTHNAVIGAHTGGFNTNSFGVSVIGTYTSAGLPAAARGALESVLAWKLGMYSQHPGANATLTSGGGANSRYPAGQVVSFRAVSGHRDAAFTECPGNQIYGQIPGIQSRVATQVVSDAVVRGAYVDMLGRGVEPAGYGGWYSYLVSGGSRVSFVNAIGATTEYRRREITKAYQFALGRGVDSGGMSGWLGAIAAGSLPSRVTPGLLASAEYYGKAGGTPEAFVRALYQKVLGRSADARAIAVWAPVVRSSGRGAAVNGIWNSTESAQRRIDTVYRQYMGRPADATAKRSWASLVIGTGEEALRNQLTGSPEYISRALQRF